jgi:hypothetical protein
MKFNAHLASGIILPFSNKIPAATQGPFIFFESSIDTFTTSFI